VNHSVKQVRSTDRSPPPEGGGISGKTPPYTGQDSRCLLLDVRFLHPALAPSKADFSSSGRPDIRSHPGKSSRINQDEGARHIPTAEWESEPGHTFRLAQSLNDASESEEPERGRKERPDGTYLPVPDRVLDNLGDLSPCEVRLCLHMIRTAYYWTDELGEFWATSGLFTAREIEEEVGGLRMSRESLRRAADTLERRGWVQQRKSDGEATAYRWTLPVPRERFTSVPAPLFYAHQALSHSALTVLLSVIRATLGWARTEDDTVMYKRTAELSASDLEAMTGLSRPTIRSAAEELEAKSALHMRRKHAGAPWEYAVDFSFFQDHLQKSYTPTNRVENSNNTRARAEQPDPKSAPAKGESRGRSNAYRVTDDWERKAINVLTADPFEIRFSRARDLVIRRAKSVVEGALKAFRRRKSDIKNPAGWMCRAIEDLWFGPSIPNKSPNVQESSGGDPFKSFLEEAQKRQEGWEWDESEGGEAPTAGEEEGGQSDLDAKPEAGVTHPEMCDLIDDLGKPPHDWETVDRPGKNPLFVPSKDLANWAYSRRDSGSERFQEAARRVVNLRARHEKRDSPLSGVNRDFCRFRTLSDRTNSLSQGLWTIFPI